MTTINSIGDTEENRPPTVPDDDEQEENEVVEEEKEEEEESNNKQFDWPSMLALCIGMLAHSVVFTAPLPFVAFMVVDFGMADNLDDAGYSAGWITGSFMLGRTVAGIAWGMASDRWGRRPCLLLTMFNVALFGLLLGFSTSFPMAVALRLAIGLGNGFMGIAKTCISELFFGSHHELKAFGMLNGVWGLGLIVGPAIGGLLSRPHIQYPHLVSRDSLLGRYPYLLPCSVCSILAAVAFVCLYVWLPETAGHAYRRRVAEETAADAADEDVTKSELGLGQRRNGRERQWRYGRGSGSSGFTRVSTESESEHGLGLTASMASTTMASFSSNIDDDDNGNNNCNDDDAGGGGDSESSLRRLPSLALSDIEVGNNNHNKYNDTDNVKTNSSSHDSDIAIVATTETNGKEPPPLTIATASTSSKSTISTSSNGDGGCSAKSGARARPATLFAMLVDPQLSLLSMVYTGFCFAVMFVDEAFPLWAVSSLDNGGLAWSSSHVGAALATMGCGMVLFQMCCYQRFIAACCGRGSASTYLRLCCVSAAAVAVLHDTARLCVIATSAHTSSQQPPSSANTSVVGITVFPSPSLSMTMTMGGYVNTTATSTSTTTITSSSTNATTIDPSGATAAATPLFLVVVVVLFVYRAAATSAFTTLGLVVNASVDREQRGTLNGLIMTFGSLGNALGPIVGSAAYAAMLPREQGRLVFVTGAVIILALGCVAGRFLKDVP